jgi:hypothetical protein
MEKNYGKVLFMFMGRGAIMGQISLCSIIAYNQVIVFKTDQIMI